MRYLIVIALSLLLFVVGCGTSWDKTTHLNNHYLDDDTVYTQVNQFAKNDTVLIIYGAFYGYEGIARGYEYGWFDDSEMCVRVRIDNNDSMWENGGTHTYVLVQPEHLIKIK